MNNSSPKSRVTLILQLTLWFICAFHLVVGTGLVFSGGFVETAAKLYGAEQTQWDGQFLYILRPLGVFMVALSIFAAAAAKSPETHRLTIYVFAGIFFVRALQRVMFGEELSQLFGIDSGRNTANMVFFFVFGGFLIAMDLLRQRGVDGGGHSPA